MFSCFQRMKHSPPCYSLCYKKKKGYEEIPGNNSNEETNVRHKSKRAVSLVFLAIVMVWLTRSYIVRLNTPHETMPTLLSLVDPKTGAFLHAQWNPVYKRLQKQQITWPVTSLAVSEPIETIYMESSSTGDAKKLAWDLKDFLGQSSSLQHSTRRRKNVSDLFVLQCGQTEKDLTKSTTLKVSNIREAATFDQLQATTNGTWKMPIPTLHYPVCQWLVIDTHKHTVKAASAIIKMPHTTQPSSIHLAYTKDPTTVLVQFISTEAGSPVIRLNSDQLITENAVTTTYTASDLCQAPANTSGPGQFQAPGYLHTVSLVHLKPGQTYKYEVGLSSGQGITWRQLESTFTTNHAAGSNTKFTYAVYGDQGCPHEGWDVGKAWIQGMVEREINVQSIHHFGDLSYAQGVAHQWDAWLDMIEPATVKWPLMVSVGNHEYDYTSDGDASKDPSGAEGPFQPKWGNFGSDSGGECGVPTNKRFHMPETGNGVFWYSYDSGLVHTIVLSAEHNLGRHSRQQAWLLQDLAAVNRTLTPWLVVEVHRPLYEGEAFWQQNNVGIAMRKEVEDILVDYAVDIVLAGHYHAYHKTCDGLYRDQCNQGGPLHLTIGTAGARLDPQNVKLIDESWTEKLIVQAYGYGRITVNNATHLHFQFIQHGGKDDKDGGKVLDDVWVKRTRN